MREQVLFGALSDTVNELQYYSPLEIYQNGAMSMANLETMLTKGIYTNDPSTLWGFDIILVPNSFNHPTSMTPKIDVPFLLYSRTNPLVIQYFTAVDTPSNIPLDGSMTFRAIATKRSN